MVEASVEPAGKAGRWWPPLLLVARPGGRPIGAILAGVGLLGGGLVWLLGLDRLPFVFCSFKMMTGLPCPTCGSTRTLARLATLDLAGALEMNPLAAVVGLGFAAWAVGDLLLLPSRRALRIGLQPALVRPVQAAALALFLANWVYLLTHGR